MSYAIANLIYGVPLHTNAENFVRSEVISEALDREEQDGFLAYYSSSGERPGAFGIKIDELDECCHHSELHIAKFMANGHQHHVEYERLLKQLPKELQDEVKAFGHPRLFILWSSS
jgi:hypothetical protein